MADIFDVIADGTRREILRQLLESRGELAVGDLVTELGIAQPTVSKHLKVLQDAGLVTRTREAQTRPVHLEAEVFDLMTKWIERYRKRAEERYQRLDALLAEMNDGPEAQHPTVSDPEVEQPLHKEGKVS